MSLTTCQVCDKTSNLARCSRCHKVSYCSKDHQKQDWKLHKKTCKPVSKNGLEVEDMKQLSLNDIGNSQKSTSATISTANDNIQTTQTQKSLNASQWAARNLVKLETFTEEDVTENDRKMVEGICKSMKAHGLCSLDNFLPEDKAEMVYNDVIRIHNKPGYFFDGEIVKPGSGRVRGDHICWIDDDYKDCPAIKSMCQKLDKIVKLFSNKSDYPYIIESRTKPMVACYPGDGTGYKRHIDNPAADGRIVTCLYYLNKGWNEECGGNLCLFPKGLKRKVICEPLFNKIIMFFSDDRNPHEVMPAFKERFAITCWYFDRDERERALSKWSQPAAAKTA